MKVKLKNLDEKSLKRMNTNHLTNLLLNCPRDSEQFRIIWNILQKRRNMVENFSKKAAEELQREYVKKLERNKIHFGHKDVEYSTEEEMLIGYIVPTYEELSPEEKEIYDNGEG
jgi:adenylate kinase family enzyme